MREIRKSGSEGGGAATLSLPLSYFVERGFNRRVRGDNTMSGSSFEFRGELLDKAPGGGEKSGGRALAQWRSVRGDAMIAGPKRTTSPCRCTFLFSPRHCSIT